MNLHTQYALFFVLGILLSFVFWWDSALNRIDDKLGDLLTIQSEARDALNCQTWEDDACEGAR